MALAIRMVTIKGHPVFLTIDHQEWKNLTVTVAECCNSAFQFVLVYLQRNIANAANITPNKSNSVARNNHIPNFAA